MDRHLPGFEPDYIRLDITRHANGSRSVRVYACEGPGFVSARDSDLYEDLTAAEASDVALASVDTLLGL